MVLQNKYKARASRRYKAKKGIPPKEGQQKTEQKPEESSSESGSAASDDSDAPAPVQFRRRRMQDNSWRYQEEEVDPHEGASLC